MPVIGGRVFAIVVFVVAFTGQKVLNRGFQDGDILTARSQHEGPQVPNNVDITHLDTISPDPNVRARHLRVEHDAALIRGCCFGGDVWGGFTRCRGYERYCDAVQNSRTAQSCQNTRKLWLPNINIFLELNVTTE